MWNATSTNHGGAFGISYGNSFSKSDLGGGSDLTSNFDFGASSDPLTRDGPNETVMVDYGFTIEQCKQLKSQIMIYKCIKNLGQLHCPPPLNSEKTVYCGKYSTNGVTPETLRCKKTDGKKWRCSKEVARQEKFCEHHMYRTRSRKPVEINNNKPRDQQTKQQVTAPRESTLLLFNSKSQLVNRHLGPITVKDIERVEITKAERKWLQTSSSNPTNYGSSSVHRQPWKHVLPDSGFPILENNDAPIGLTNASLSNNNNNMINTSTSCSLPIDGEFGKVQAAVDENCPTSHTLSINGEFGRAQEVDENCRTSYTLPVHVDGDFGKVHENCPTSYTLPMDGEFAKVQTDTDSGFGEHAMWTSPEIWEPSTFAQTLCMGPLSSPQYSMSEWETIVSGDPQRYANTNSVCNSPWEYGLML